MNESYGINQNFVLIHLVAALTCKVSSDKNKVTYISSDIDKAIRYRRYNASITALVKVSLDCLIFNYSS